MVTRRPQASGYPVRHILPARCLGPPPSARINDSLPNQCQFPACLKSYKYNASLLCHQYCEHGRQAVDEEYFLRSYNDCKRTNENAFKNEENRQRTFGGEDRLANAGQEAIPPLTADLEGYPYRTPPYRHKCEYQGCQKSFARKSWLQRHKRDVHRERAIDEKPILCPYSDCKWANGIGFQREENRQRHLQRVHKCSNKAQRAGTVGESPGNGLEFDSSLAEAMNRTYDAPNCDIFENLDTNFSTVLQEVHSDNQESDIEIAAVTRLVDDWDKAMTKGLIRRTEEPDRRIKHCMHSNKQSQIVWQMAKAQQKESPRMFSEAMRALAAELKTPNFITGLLGIIVQSTVKHVRPLQVTHYVDIECEEIAIEKLGILFHHSTHRFGWPGGLITCVQDLRYLPIHLEQQYLELQGKGRCYPI